MPYGIQQPAISGQLSQLEKTLETKLFHRRPFGLTPAGIKLFAEIQPFFAGLSELPDQIREQGTRHLRLAAPTTILRDYLPKLLIEYRRQHRNFRLTLHEANQAIAEELLRRREIDLAISELEGKPVSPISSCMLLRLPLVLVVPDRSRFRTLGDFFRPGAVPQTLISLPPDEVISKHFQTGVRKAGFSWVPAIEASSLDLIDLYTSLGFGVGASVVAPGLKRRRSLRIVPLPGFSPVTIAALWSGELSEPAATFLANIRELATQLGLPS
jgi:DNA-binding transcriptional LysR family regulator